MNVQQGEADEVLAQRAKDGDAAAMETLFRVFEHRIRGIATPFFMPGADRDDVLQEGRIGLMKAVRDYNAGVSVSFRYFADMCIRRNIITTIKKSTRQKHQALNSAHSLDAPLYSHDDHNLSLHDTFADDTLADNAQAIVTQELTKQVREAILLGLSELEARVLLEYMHGYTYAEAAQRLGISVKSADNAMQRLRKKVTANIQGVLARFYAA